jgi:hypothetical protein
MKRSETASHSSQVDPQSGELIQVRLLAAATGEGRGVRRLSSTVTPVLHDARLD